jgi:hypothetical protein
MANFDSLCVTGFEYVPNQLLQREVNGLANRMGWDARLCLVPVQGSALDGVYLYNISYKMISVCCLIYGMYCPI